MDAEKVKKLRKELHNLSGDRGVPLPIHIELAASNHLYREEDCLFLWDDANEVVYVVCNNTQYTNTTDERLYPMNIWAISYDEILQMSVPVDRLCLDNFLASKVGTLTNEETRKRYYNDITALYDDTTYLMGGVSPTTAKRGLKPDDEIVDKDANRFL